MHVSHPHINFSRAVIFFTWEHDVFRMSLSFDSDTITVLFLPIASSNDSIMWQDIFEAAEEAEVEEAMSLLANPLPIEAGDYQGCE